MKKAGATMAMLALALLLLVPQATNAALLGDVSHLATTNVNSFIAVLAASGFLQVRRSEEEWWW